MPLKFKCVACGKDIVVKFSTKGQKVECKQCKVENIVPADAIVTLDEPDYAKPLIQQKEKKQAPREEIRIPPQPNLLGPKEIGTLLSDLFTVYFNKFFYYIGIAIILPLIFSIPIGILLALLIPNIIVIMDSNRTSILPEILFVFIAVIIFCIILSITYAIVEGALIHAVSVQYFKPIRIWESYNAAWKKILKILCVELFGGIMAFLLMCTIIGIPIAIYLTVRFSFTMNSIIIENCGIVQSFKRSWFLTAKNWWRCFLFMSIVYIIGLVFGFIIGLIPIVSIFLSVGIGPFYTIAYTLQYFDLRVKKENFNQNKLAEELLLNAGNS